MNIFHYLGLVLIFVCSCSLLSNTVLADTEGISGRLVGLQTVGPGSDTFSTFRGSIFINENSGVIQEYKWGGSTCTGEVSVKDVDIANFSRALPKFHLQIIPFYKRGQGGARCLKRYILVPKFFIDDV